ncbi:Protein ImuB [Paraburkholderia solisilvae]|uniref:Protein ImuB n=1 Tax=Paraburkholderia solisilvae TaxID=624376 RepID=A0A6J5EVR3_9BURK|nr:Protein ImuB [Paraburkholderia solisilvae]
MPKLPLEVFQPKWLRDDADAAAVKAAHGCAVLEKGVVVIVDRAARAVGVRVGMKRAGVNTLSAQTRLYERDSARENAVQREVGIALMKFSPDVALLDEATVIVEVGASLRLFGGMLSLYRLVKALLDTFGLSARISVAPTGQGAWLLAKHGNRRVLQITSLERALAPLPMYAVPEIRPFADWFTGLGCASIADVRRLPRAGLQRRCGEHLLDSLDRAFGLAPELFDWLELPPTFSARIELPDRLEQADGAVFAAHRLLAQLCGWLCAKQLAAAAVTFSFEHERGRQALAPTLIEIALGEPTWREEHLLRLVKERLHRAELPAPAIALRLDATKIASAQPVNDNLFPEPGGTPEDHARLLELLIARLGVENVLRPAPTADYRPEVANRWVPVGAREKKSVLPQSLPRPTWMLETPIRLLTRQNRPFYGSPLRLASPAERIEAGWFDNGLITRDYYVAQAENRSCYWVYLERVGSRAAEEEQEQRWFLHGLFG